jgi:predicted dehydrogenase
VGADGVLITASTKDSSLISQSARMSRKRGRIILVGVTGLELNRAEFYEKELSFQVSCSYGPGRYDENYEQRGQDYPLPFVRWTEKRNFQAVLQAISSGKLQVKPLISEVVPLDRYQDIYGKIGSKKTIASILAYAEDEKPLSRIIQIGGVSAPLSAGTLGIIGAGNYTKATMLPALKKVKTPISHVASNSGVSGTFLAKKYGIPNTTTDYKEILANEKVSWVAITTRHNLHASMTIEALKAGKNVFVEKPLALTQAELTEVTNVKIETGKAVVVGYNRRFSPFSMKMKQLLSKGEPMNMIATMNAGHIPAESWVQDMQIGGGRIVGEACHMVDLMIFLSQSQVVSVHMSAMGLNPESRTDNATLTLKFANGSMGTIHYFANGHKAYSKERVEVYQSGKTLILDNFRKLQGYGFKGFSSMSSKLDKGHNNMFAALSQLTSGATQLPITFTEIFNSTSTVLKAIESLKTGETIGLE